MMSSSSSTPPGENQGHVPKVAFFGDARCIGSVYAQGRRERLEGMAEVFPHVINRDNFDLHARELEGIEAIFSTWGMPALTSEEVRRLPALRALFYAAGTVQIFARPFLDNGVTVVSAWKANAIPVAEFTTAHILLATKGWHRNTREYTSPQACPTAFRGRGNFGETVALLGAGAIGRKVVELLRPFNLRIVVFDPFLPDDAARRLGVEKTTLEDAFARAFVVSNHLADNPQTRGMLKRPLFASMRQGAVFINTGRGATVDEPGLCGVMQERPDLTAVLDVTTMEPPGEDSPLYSLPNVRLSTHVAGSLGDEIVRMADICIEDFQRWTRGEPLLNEVSKAMLETMA